MLASFWTNPPTETKLKTQKPHSYRASDRTAHLITKKPKPNFVAAKTELSPTRILVLPLLSSTQQEPKSEVAVTGSSTIADPTVALAPNSSSRTIQEQVADAIAFAKRTVTALEPVAGRPPNETAIPVAIVLARPEIGSISDLEGKVVAMDEEYSDLRGDILVAFVLAGALPDEFSVGHTTAINRLLKGEVPAAVLALVSADSAKEFPDIAGFKNFQVPLYSRSSAGNRDTPKRS